jgi:hypothetical protein
LVPDTARRVGFALCGMHLKQVRRVKLQDNLALRARQWL